MKKMGNLIGGFATVIWVILIIAVPVLWVLGAIHSVKKYDTVDNVFSILTPWGVYRGIEMFYHKDRKYDWKEELKGDTKIMFYVFDQSQSNNSDPMQVQSEIQEFSKHIEDFPENRLNYLKSSARMYIAFEEDFFRDISKIDSSLKNPGDSIWGSSTINLSDSLYELYGYGKGRLALKQFTLTFDNYLKHVPNDEADNKLRKESGRIQQRQMEEAIFDVYYRLFNERYATPANKN